MAVKILLIDDDQGLRDSIQELLKPGGYLVVEASNCEKALSLLQSERFDLILLDITLPDRSGFSVLKFCNENQIASKVIVITGAERFGDEIRSATLGAGDYITKPYDPALLMKSIDHVLSGEPPANPKLLIVRGGDFIVSATTGDLDVKASKNGLAEIAAIGSHHLRDYTILIDLREVNSRLSITDIYELASELAKYGDTFQRKTAVLAQVGEDTDQAEFFETASMNRGFQIRAFTDFERAIGWLASSPQPTEEPIT